MKIIQDLQVKLTPYWAGYLDAVNRTYKQYEAATITPGDSVWVAVYIRVSTTEQAEEGYSLREQERECAASLPNATAGRSTRSTRMTAIPARVTIVRLSSACGGCGRRQVPGGRHPQAGPSLSQRAGHAGDLQRLAEPGRLPGVGV